MYKITLPNFEGPFDLMLYFIKRDELNIYDIPIARITEEFLNYIRIMQYFDLELAGEFLLMAATLMYIKSQMLLPRLDNKDGEEIEDPRTQLVQKLIEYRQIKEAAGELRALSDEQRYTYYRKYFANDLDETHNKVQYKNASLFDLMKAFQNVLKRAEDEQKEHVVNITTVTVDEKREMVVGLLQKKKRLSFFEIVNRQPRIHIIVTFLALLELIKNQLIIIRQTELFDDIIISEKPALSLN